AGKTDVSLTVAYGPSQKAVTYQFLHLAAQRTVRLRLSGTADAYAVRVLLPAGQKAVSANVNGKPVRIVTEKVEDSPYAVLEPLPGGMQEVEIRYGR
ncbi:MAG TPA: hypothetical protein VHK69_08250, partial [Chitinophagaceae bacterium]|nr:hypothetical protein [Chitinophagaceae bacterium]